MSKPILVFDSHPVQYRVPIWQAIEKLKPNSVYVAYASDCSVKGHSDAGFGKIISWDIPMLEGYTNTILNSENGEPLSGWGSLTGKGVADLIKKINPNVVFLTGLNYKFDITALIWAKIFRKQVWLRCETQDFVTDRVWYKSIIRSFFYRAIYICIDKMFYIGELNKLHYLAHGVNNDKLVPARYCTVDRFDAMSEAEKIALRIQARVAANIETDRFVIGFSGKLISKKNPEIIYEALTHLPKEVLKNCCIYFLGSGELEPILQKKAKYWQENYGVSSFFSGFVNQTELPMHYLAMDILVLPSKKMGETWGLVVNEALQAGCGVIVSNHVGSSADFKSLERFRIFVDADAKQLATQITELANYTRSFNWAKDFLKNYTIEQVSYSILESL